MKRSTHTVCKIVAAIACALCFSACEVVFLNPLPSSPGAKRDERLSGRWSAKGKVEHKVYVQFDGGAGAQTNVSIFSEDEVQNPVFTMTTVKLGKHDYMNLKPTDKKHKGYLILRYAVEGNQLIVRALDSEKVKAAIGQGKLKGEGGAREKELITISDTPERVAEFLDSAAGDEAFLHEEIFEKVGGNPGSAGGPPASMR